MKSSPPRIATWVFNRFGPRNEELGGDLIEEWRNGRSRMWYWRQILIAIGVNLQSEVLRHKLDAIKAIIIGFVGLYFLHAVSGRGSGVWSVLIHVNLPLAQSDMRRYYELFNWIMPLEIFLISIASGWIVGRLNYRYHRAVLMTLVIAWTPWFGFSTFPYIRMLVKDSIDQPRFRPYLAHFILRFLAAVAGISLGGIWSAPRKGPHQPMIPKF